MDPVKRQEWLLRARSAEHRKLVDNTRRLVERALRRASFACSWSTGKDSTAMTHLVLSVDASIPIITQCDDCDWPDKAVYIDTVREALGWAPHIVRPDFSVWEYMCEHQVFGDEFCAQSHELTRDGFLQPLKTKQEELCCNGVFVGLRAQESGPRARNIFSRGALYQVKSGEWRCLPMAYWRSDDVFAYLVSHDVPINPCYLRNKFEQPEDIRISWAVPAPSTVRRGGMEHIRYYYPEMFRRLREKGLY